AEARPNGWRPVVLAERQASRRDQKVPRGTDQQLLTRESAATERSVARRASSRTSPREDDARAHRLHQMLNFGELGRRSRQDWPGGRPCGWIRDPNGGQESLVGHSSAAGGGVCVEPVAAGSRRSFHW